MQPKHMTVFAEALRRLAAAKPLDDGDDSDDPDDEPDPDDDGDYTDDPNPEGDPNQLYDDDGFPIDSPEESAAEDAEIAAQDKQDAREAAAAKQSAMPPPPLPGLAAKKPVKGKNPPARGGHAKTVAVSPLHHYLTQMANKTFDHGNRQ